MLQNFFLCFAEENNIMNRAFKHSNHSVLRCGLMHFEALPYSLENNAAHPDLQPLLKAL